MTKYAGPVSSLISSHLATRVKDFSRGLTRKDWILLRTLFLALTKWKLMLISDQAKDVAKKCLKGGGSTYSFSIAGLPPRS